MVSDESNDSVFIRFDNINVVRNSDPSGNLPIRKAYSHKAYVYIRITIKMTAIEYSKLNIVSIGEN